MNKLKKKPGIALLVFGFLLVALICIVRLEITSMDYKWKEWDTIENLINIHAQALYLAGHALGISAILSGILIFEIYQLKKKILMIENDLKLKGASTKGSTQLMDTNPNSTDANQ